MVRYRGALLFGLLLFAASAAASGPARAAAPACTPALTAAADGSFAQAGWDASPARLTRLAALTRDRFAGAARRLCVAGVLTPADLARLRRMIVQNGEGATEPLLYREDGMAPGTFIFQFAFQNGGPPEPAAFEQALRCWKNPKKVNCYED
jgi:hypothetical protein